MFPIQKNWSVIFLFLFLICFYLFQVAFEQEKMDIARFQKDEE